MNLDELKKAAEAAHKATSGNNWKTDSWGDKGTKVVCGMEDIISFKRPEICNHVALANPTTILALLKVVDAARVSCSMNFSGGFAAIRYALKELDA